MQRSFMKLHKNSLSSVILIGDFKSFKDLEYIFMVPKMFEPSEFDCSKLLE